MRRILVLTVACGVVLGGAVPALAATSTAGSEQAAPRTCSAAFYDGDSRLGPQQLPVAGRVGREVRRYRRTGDRTVAGFLSTYYDSATSSWRYPPDNGYVIRHGKPVEFHARLRDGRRIDRFGSEYGSFLAPQGLRYAARSIPPASLDGTPAAGCNYHDYEVTRPFTVDAGPIAAWFAQPGGGRQYQLDATLIPGAPATINVVWLVANGYLKRIV
jgi:Tuberculosis necrotizing toxin